MRAAREGHLQTATASLLASLPQQTLDLFRRIEDVANRAGLFKHATPQLWRCRRGVKAEVPKSGKHLGSPPAAFAGDGRLNARGQSVFYGSTTLEGAVVEVASHVAPDVELWCGRFTPSRALYHLDVRETPARPSRFAPGARDDWDAVTFLQRFASSISEPRTGQPRHYLPTQIFVAYLLAAPEPLRVDAIRFGSSVVSTVENWVVFVDHEHCGDSQPAQTTTDELFMLLEPSTKRFVVANDPDLCL